MRRDHHAHFGILTPDAAGYARGRAADLEEGLP